MNGSSPLEVVTPYTDNDIWNIDFVQKGDIIFLTDGAHKPKELQRNSDGSWALSDYINEYGPFKNQDKNIKGYFTYSSGSAFVNSSDYEFSTNDVGRIFQIETYFASSTIYSNINSTTIRDGLKDTVILVGSSWSFTTSGTWSGKISIEVSEDGTVWRKYKTISSTINGSVGSYNASITGDFDDIVFVRINADDLDDPETNPCQLTFQAIGFYENLSFEITDFINTGKCEISVEVYEDAIVEYSDMTTSDSAGLLQESAWGGEYGYPKLVTFYQDRLVFANNNGNPFTIWMTETSAYHSFRVHIDLLDSDSISTNVLGTGLDEINAIVPLRSLIAFTGRGEFRTNIDAISATDNFILPQQSFGGASKIKPCIIDNSCIFVRPTKDEIRDFFYQYQIDAYAGDQLDILARHLFVGKEIKQIAYQSQEKIIWVLFEDGTMVYCTYMKDQEVLGWNVFETQGDILSISTIIEDNIETLYMAVERETGTFIEKLSNRMESDNIEDQIFSDCVNIYEGAYINIVTGLSYLEGQTVAVLADGYVYSKTITNGEIELTIPAKKVIIGLPYETIIETLDVNFNTNDGSTMPLKRRIVGADISFIKSCSCKATTSNSEKEDDVIIGRPENYNKAIEPQSAIKDIIFQSSHDKKTHIIVKQDKPLPITITGITQKIVYGDK
jgi:hypothetical protein